MTSGESWLIRAQDRPSGDAIGELGSSFLVGNGLLGYRGTLEEDTNECMTATIVAGLYDQVGDKWREPVNAPNALALQVIAGGKALDARTDVLASHSQTLDLHRAVHERRTVFTLDGGAEITLACTRFASATSLHLLCAWCVLESSRDIGVIVRVRIDGRVWDLNGPHLEDMKSRADAGIATVAAKTHEKGETVAVSQAIVAPGAPVRWTSAEEGTAADVEVSLAAGKPFELDVLATVFTSLDGPDPIGRSRRECQEAAERGFSRLLEEHSACWHSRWERCDIVIDGDEEAQRALRFNMYHLLSIAPGHSPRLSIPARGLSGQMYKGAVFWDTEVFMLPFFIHTFPAVARNLLMYRVHTLDGARRKAREYGHRGAFYAWESQESGDDACTLFNIPDVITGRLIRTYFRDKQIHISADIVYAIWNYHEATGDDSLLLDGGAEAVFECSRFLLSTLYFSRENNRYEALDVTGPDEYHERVHNDAYTNWIIAHALDVCVRVFALLQRSYPREAALLLGRLEFSRDLAAIRETLGMLYQPHSGKDTLVIPQFDGYLALEDAPLEEVLGRKLHPNEYLGGGNGVATTTQVIKQADVVLGLALLGNGFSRSVKAANWEYYEPRTEHGSSLSACAYSIVAAETGRPDAAYAYFMKAARTDLDADRKSFVGTLFIGGTHPAASGGAWMAAVFGLCGISVRGATIVLSPRLPGHWRKVDVPLVVRGCAVRISVREHYVRVEADPAADLRFIVGGREHRVPSHGCLEVDLAPDRGAG